VNKEMYIVILRRFRDGSKGNTPKNWEPKVGFALTTILQHTDRFLSRIY